MNSPLPCKKISLGNSLSEDLMDVLQNKKRLPGYVFTSSDLFNLEREAIIKNEWICIGAPHLGLENNSAKPFEFMGQPIILTKSKDGELRVFHNVCRHRGAELLQSPHKGGVMVCPYHSWAFQLDGGCRGTPHAGGFGIHEDQYLKDKDLSLYPIRFEEWAGLLFITMDNERASFAETIKPLTARWGHPDLSQLKIDPALTSHAELKGNWKLAAENFVESYHVPAIHKALQRINPMENHGQILGGELYVGQSGTDLQADYMKGSWTAEPMVDMTLEDGDYDAIFLYPNAIITIMNDNAFTLTVEPVGPDHTKETINWHFAGPKGLHEDGAKNRREFQEFLIQVNGEDIGIVESMQRSRSSMGFDGGQFTRAHEQASEQLQRLYAAAMLRASGVDTRKIVKLPFADIDLEYV